MDDKVDFDALLLENFELMLIGKDNSLQTELYMYYAVLKIKLFQRWGQIEDLEEAVEKGKHAVTETQEEDEAYAGRLKNL